MPEVFEFFAVTANGSLYRVRKSTGDSGPEIMKIAENRRGSLAIGEKMNSHPGEFVGITNFGLIIYRTERYSNGRPHSARQTNTKFHFGRTSKITGLFLKEENARECLSHNDQRPWSIDWRQLTVKTLGAIGNNHSTFILDEDLLPLLV